MLLLDSQITAPPNEAITKIIATSEFYFSTPVEDERASLINRLEAMRAELQDDEESSFDDATLSRAARFIAVTRPYKFPTEVSAGADASIGVFLDLPGGGTFYADFLANGRTRLLARSRTAPDVKLIARSEDEAVRMFTAHVPQAVFGTLVVRNHANTTFVPTLALPV